jgi:hypothetical protein
MKITFNDLIKELDKKVIGERSPKITLLIVSLLSKVINARASSSNLMVTALRSTGKDHIVKSVIELFEGNYEYRSRISEKAINYMSPEDDSWNGKILYLEDITDKVLNSEVLKVFMSGGNEVSIVENGKERHIKIHGKPIIIITSAKATPNSEVLSRLNILKLDESNEQTRQVIMKQALCDMEEKEVNYDKKIIKFIKNLKRCSVNIPYADKIGKVFPCDDTSDRRRIGRFLDYIKAVAVFHQKERVKKKGVIYANLDDYDYVRDIFKLIDSNLVNIPVSERQKEIIGLLKGSETPLIKTEIIQRMERGITLNSLKPHIDSLFNMGIIDEFSGEDAFGRKQHSYKLNEKYLKQKPVDLPKGVDLDKEDTEDNEDTEDTEDVEVIKI